MIGLELGAKIVTKGQTILLCVGFVLNPHK